METNEFVEQLQKHGINFFTGVPDSLLKPLGNYLMKIYGVSNKHIIASNEVIVAIAAGYHLATGRFLVSICKTVVWVILLTYGIFIKSKVYLFLVFL